VSRAIAVAFALVATVAHADPDGAAVDRAKVHFKQGRALQAAGDFARAADEYKAAYELDPRPEMLFNIGQAFRLAGAKREALDYFKRYLDQQPDGSGAAEARQHVQALTKETEETVVVIRPSVDPCGIPDCLVPNVTGVTLDPSAAETPTVAWPPLRIAGVVGAGAGIVAVGIGVKLGFDARADADAITHHVGPWTEADRATYDAGQTANRNMAIAYCVGAALVATGGVLYYLGVRRARVVAIVAPGGASAAIAGSF
jgi:tetratricopeptide (TPR) repeat protein